MNKVEIIKVRVSDSEKVRISLLASSLNISVSELVRRQLLNEPVTDSKKEELKAFNERTKQISKIGNNLNQISKKINGGGAPDHEAILMIAAALRELG